MRDKINLWNPTVPEGDNELDPIEPKYCPKCLESVDDCICDLIDKIEAEQIEAESKRLINN
jgi:hypothetical protein